MKKYLISNEGQFYKANLHCHTTFSDGKLTPAEVKELYKSLGYSIVAYTDHGIFITHDELTDENFLSLHGCEYDVCDDDPPTWAQKRNCHFCAIAIDPETIIQPFWHRTRYLYRNRELVKFDESKPDYDKYFTGECITEMMTGLRDAGFFVTYNHPVWSLEHYPEYMGYSGMHALEMFNGGCLVNGYDDYNPHVYDDLLMSGKKIYCIGADDNHNYVPLSSRYNDSGVAFTMIKAKSLEYREVMRALLAGDVYASEGPIINELYYEDGYVHIKTEPADRIFISYDIREAKIAYGEKEFITEASFKIPTNAKYFRITVVDKCGKHACTNGYFLEDFMENEV